MRLITYSLRIDKKHIRKIKQIAKLEGRTTAGIIRDAIKKYIESYILVK